MPSTTHVSCNLTPSLFTLDRRIRVPPIYNPSWELWFFSFFWEQYFYHTFTTIQTPKHSSVSPWSHCTSAINHIPLYVFLNYGTAAVRVQVLVFSLYSFRETVLTRYDIGAATAKGRATTHVAVIQTPLSCYPSQLKYKRGVFPRLGEWVQIEIFVKNAEVCIPNYSYRTLVTA